MYHISDIKGIIFDYGGTLDTGGCHWGKMLWHAYQRAGVPVTEQLFRAAYVHAERTLGKNPIVQCNDTFRQTLSVKIGLQMDYIDAALSADIQASVGTIGSVRQQYPAVVLDDLYALTCCHTQHSREILQQLQQQYPLVLVSNFYGNMETVLREFGFNGVFQQVIESAVVGIRKPDSRIFTLGIKALGLQPHEVLVVGDSMSKDILPAKDAGCRTVWLKGEGWTDEPEDESFPDRIITDLKELTDEWN